MTQERLADCHLASFGSANYFLPTNCKNLVVSHPPFPWRACERRLEESFYGIDESLSMVIAPPDLVFLPEGYR